MPRAQKKKFARKGRYQPYKKGLSKKQYNAVKAVVKRQVTKTEETKFFKYAADFTLTGSNNLISYNLFYYSSAGTSNNQMIGDKLRWKGICVKYAIRNADFTTGFVWKDQPVIIDMYLLRTNVYKTTTSLTLAEIFNESGSDPNIGFLNNSTKCLAKRTLRITPDRGSATPQQKILNGKIWLKRNQIISFKDFGTSYDLKDGRNYYLMFVNRSPTSEKSYIGFSWQNYFTDS